jgi:hypothetical protein
MPQNGPPRDTALRVAAGSSVVAQPNDPTGPSVAHPDPLAAHPQEKAHLASVAAPIPKPHKHTPFDPPPKSKDNLPPCFPSGTLLANLLVNAAWIIPSPQRLSIDRS